MANWSCFSDLLQMCVKLQSYGKSQKPLKPMVFCNYQASLSISKFTLPGRNEALNFYARTFHLSFHVRMNSFAVLEAALILVIFRIFLLISLTSGFDNGCV